MRKGYHHLRLLFARSRTGRDWRTAGNNDSGGRVRQRSAVCSNAGRVGAATLGAALLVAAVALDCLHAQAANPSATTPAIPDKKLAETHCAACHGADGNSTNPQFPKIAGQNPDYIREQLYAFKSGARPSPVMSAMASPLTDEQMDELARYFSDQPRKPDVVKNPQLAQLGARIFTEPSRAGPPCAACHGRGGFGPGGMMGGPMGMMMGGGMGRMMGNIGPVPNLYGQHASYITKQLDAFASGARRNSIMSPIAASLSEQDRHAVAEYLSGLQ